SAQGIAVSYVRDNIKFLFEHSDFPGPAIFDVKPKAGTIIVTINTKHPASEHFFGLLRNEDDPSMDSPALKGLKLLLTAWARMEDEAGNQRRQFLEDIRIEWGQIARDFLREVND